MCKAILDTDNDMMLHRLASFIVRRLRKSASPRPWDLPAAISLEELAQDEEHLELKLGPSIRDFAGGGVLDSATLTVLVRLRKPRSIFEFGTGFGRSTTLFALNVPDAEIFTLSLPDNPETGRIFQHQPWAAHIHQLLGDSMYFNCEPWYGQIDFVFVDGNHLSPFVDHDTHEAFRVVSPTGWIVWHDVNQDTPDVLRCLSATHGRDIAWIKGTRYALWRAS
jgi:predicted O-methyltransferase YrrM